MVFLLEVLVVRELAEPEGVTSTVVVEARAWLADNQWILDLAAADPFLTGLVGHVDPNRPEFRAELDQLADHPYFCGIRCAGQYFETVERGSFLDDRAYLAAQNLQLNVLIREPQFDGLLTLAERVPTLRIVVDHIAHMPIDGGAVQSVWVDHYQGLANLPNIYMKVSALMEQCVIQPAPAEIDYYRPTKVGLLDIPNLFL